MEKKRELLKFQGHVGGAVYVDPDEVIEVHGAGGDLTGTHAVIVLAGDHGPWSIVVGTTEEIGEAINAGRR